MPPQRAALAVTVRPYRLGTDPGCPELPWVARSTSRSRLRSEPGKRSDRQWSPCRSTRSPRTPSSRGPAPPFRWCCPPRQEGPSPRLPWLDRPSRLRARPRRRLSLGIASLPCRPPLSSTLGPNVLGVSGTVHDSAGPREPGRRRNHRDVSRPSSMGPPDGARGSRQVRTPGFVRHTGSVLEPNRGGSDGARGALRDPGR